MLLLFEIENPPVPFRNFGVAAENSFLIKIILNNIGL